MTITKFVKHPLADDFCFYGQASHGFRFYCFPNGLMKFWRLRAGIAFAADPPEELMTEVKRRWLAERVAA
jgi:hypothetical protein